MDCFAEKPSMDVSPVVERKIDNNYSVLYHLIDGYVIEEADTPFQLDTGSLLTKQQLQDIWRKQQELIAKENEIERNNQMQSEESVDEEPEKEEMQLCENCGKTGKDHYSARFCSVICVRRHNMAQARESRSRGIQMKLKKSEEQATEESPKKRFNDSPPLSPVSPYVPMVDGGDGTPAPLSPTKWSVGNVCDFIQSLPDGEYFVKDFREHEIDGSALVLIREDHLIHSMNIKLGPALKLCSHIRQFLER